MWHRLLLSLRIRNDFDWSPPSFLPEVAHPYFESAGRRCCDHCGGGKFHTIHQPPYNVRRSVEVVAAELRKANPNEYPARVVLHDIVTGEAGTVLQRAAYVEREHGA